MENTITSKRKAYSAVEKAALIAAYKASGLSKKEWCQENAIGLEAAGSSGTVRLLPMP